MAHKRIAYGCFAYLCGMAWQSYRRVPEESGYVLVGMEEKDGLIRPQHWRDK